MHRFANGVPMLDTNTSAACALVGGVASKASWANLGLKISSSRVQRRDGRLRFILSEAPTPLKVRCLSRIVRLSQVKERHTYRDARLCCKCRLLLVDVRRNPWFGVVRLPGSSTMRI